MRRLLAADLDGLISIFRSEEEGVEKVEEEGGEEVTTHACIIQLLVRVVGEQARMAQHLQRNKKQSHQKLRLLIVVRVLGV